MCLLPGGGQASYNLFLLNTTQDCIPETIFVIARREVFTQYKLLREKRFKTWPVGWMPECITSGNFSSPFNVYLAVSPSNKYYFICENCSEILEIVVCLTVSDIHV